jgi:hypothetical protein
LIAVEVKSAATFNPQFLKGITWFRALVGERCREGHVFYNGPMELSVQDVRVANPFQSGRFL